MTIKQLNPKFVALILAGLLVLVWGALIAVLMLLQPSVAMRTIVVTVAAVATEGILYAGAAFFGLTLFQKVRGFLRPRSSRRPESTITRV